MHSSLQSKSMNIKLCFDVLVQSTYETFHNTLVQPGGATDVFETKHVHSALVSANTFAAFYAHAVEKRRCDIEGVWGLSGPCCLRDQFTKFNDFEAVDCIEAFEMCTQTILLAVRKSSEMCSAIETSKGLGPLFEVLVVRSAVSFSDTAASLDFERSQGHEQRLPMWSCEIELRRNAASALNDVEFDCSDVARVVRAVERCKPILGSSTHTTVLLVLTRVQRV